MLADVCRRLACCIGGGLIMVMADVYGFGRVYCEAGVVDFSSATNALVMESLAGSAAKDPPVLTDAASPIGCVDYECRLGKHDVT